MSVDPVGTVSVAAVEALIASETNALAADAEALRAQVGVGDIVQATVLASNGLTDLLNILGNRVAASLPPALRPGDVISAQVTGFDGPRILLAIVDSAPAALDGSAPAAAVLPGAAPPAADVPPGRLAPPAAVFVAATVRPPAGTPAPGTPGEATAPAAPGAPRGAPSAAGSLGAELGAIEARLAAARAGSIVVAAPGLGSAPAAARGAVPTAPPARPFAVPPTIVASAAVAAARSPAATVAAPAGSAAPPDGLARYRDPLALVRALRLPVTPANVAAAKLALEEPQRLPDALALLEGALPAGNDPRIATLRTLAAFVGRLDPRSPQLAAQISAYVEHVVGGFEPKLAQQLAAQAASQAPAPGENGTAPVPAPAASAAGQADAGRTAGGEPPATAPGAAAPVGPAVPTLPVVALAHAAERSAAVGHDLKAQLFALLTNPPRGGGDDLVPSAASALTAVTSVQLAAAQAIANVPGSVVFSLPMFLGAGFANAQLTVDRDAPEPAGKPLDGDNFHIAFVLETKHLGTVAIDLQTVGRSVALAVKTEATRSAQKFGSSIERLTSRLESLNYRVASADASVARPPAAPEAAPSEGAADVPSAAPGGVNARA